MKSALFIVVALCLTAACGFAAEKPVTFVPAKADAVTGDWQGDGGGMVAQVIATGEGSYQANLLKSFDAADKLLAVLKGTASGETVTFTGDGWTATIAQAQFKGHKDSESLNLRPITRSPSSVSASSAGAR